MNTTILFIDDETALGTLYQQAFQASGIVCDYASNGEAGLVQAQKTKPALILLDIMMPGLDGLEVLQRLKNDKELKDIPVLLVTNLSSESIDISVREKGALDILNKSIFKPREIVQKVKEILQIP